MIKKINTLKGINKKGDKLISVYWFAILVIVAIGIVLMVNTFYGENYDVRSQEAEILAQKVADCIYFGGEFNSLIVNPQGGFREDFNDNFLKMCNLNFTIEGGLERPPYYVEVGFFPDGDLKKSSFTMLDGNKNWKPDCSVGVSQRANLVTCKEKEFFAVTKSDSVYLIKILSIIGKIDENTN